MTFRILVFIALLFVRPTNAEPSWNPKVAASYLDTRMEWWAAWKTSARDHETFCISCHTALPYALSRPVLVNVAGASPVEQKVIDNVSKRAQLWAEVEPFYPDRNGDPKTKESRGTEAVINALILTKQNPKSPLARTALDNMWKEQVTNGAESGALPWLQFHNAPWEGDSQYFGSALAALAIGFAPVEYRSSPQVAEPLKRLQAYLVRERPSQKLIDRMILLWASTKLPGLLTAAERNALIDEALGKQQDDGGFSLSAFIGDWRRKDNTPLEAKSDGYATGVVAFVLQETGMKRDQPQLKKALAWLEQNQQPDGRWLAYSVNKQRDLSTDVGRFMSDAATAFAVLALTR